MESSNNKYSFKLDASGIKHEEIQGIIMNENLNQASIAQQELKITGKSDINIHASIFNSAKWEIHGQWFSSIPLAQYTDANIELREIQINLPIELASSRDGDIIDIEDRHGKIYIERLLFDKYLFENINLEPIVTENKIRIQHDITFNLWGGKIMIYDLRADNITSSARALYTSIKIEDLNIEEMIQGSSFPLSGSIDGEVPSVIYKNDIIDFEGALNIMLMGGVVRTEHLYIKRPFSKGRKLGVSIYWEGIQLERLTKKIPIGKISGVINGQLTDFEMEYNQPSRFILEVRSIKKRGVKQKISVEALNNISLIGTGSSAIQRVLNSGLNRFFSFYPYSKIGFKCSLENDVFSLRGLIREAGREYLIRRSFFRGVDIINQNPDNTISFKDMAERINRIFKERREAVRK